MATGYSLKKYDNSKCVSNLLDTDNWTSFLDDSNGTKIGQYAIGGPTLEMWCESWNSVVNSHSTFKKLYAKDTANYGYYVSSDTTEKQNYLYMNDTTDSLSSTDLSELGQQFPMYFPHTSLYSNCSSYLLASPSAQSKYYFVTVSYTGRVGSCYYNNKNGLRPVVCLNSDVSATYDANTKTYTLSK